EACDLLGERYPLADPGAVERAVVRAGAGVDAQLDPEPLSRLDPHGSGTGVFFRSKLSHSRSNLSRSGRAPRWSCTSTSSACPCVMVAALSWNSISLRAPWGKTRSASA